MLAARLALQSASSLGAITSADCVSCACRRLGANYLMLPANAPKCSHHNNHHEVRYKKSALPSPGHAPTAVCDSVTSAASFLLPMRFSSVAAPKDGGLHAD